MDPTLQLFLDYVMNSMEWLQVSHDKIRADLESLMASQFVLDYCKEFGNEIKGQGRK
jgi:hypothetical protein